MELPHVTCFNWEEKIPIPKRLEDLCSNAIAAAFTDLAESYKALDLHEQEDVAQRLSTNLPLDIACLHVQSKKYWQRRWDTLDEGPRVLKEDESHRRLYLESILSTIIESYGGEVEEERKLWSQLELFGKEIKDLKIRHLQRVEIKPKESSFELSNSEPEDHTWPGSVEKSERQPVYTLLDIPAVLQQLPNLETFSFCSAQKCGAEDFSVRGINYPEEDCSRLATALSENATKLKTLRWTVSSLDDVRLERFLQSFSLASSLISLDLSHNALGPDSVPHIAAFLILCRQLKFLNLRDNRLGCFGAWKLAESLNEQETSITSLDLSLNNIKDTGGSNMCRELAKNKSLKLEFLGLSGNHLHHEFVSAFVHLLERVKSLTRVDLSCNDIDQEDGERIVEALTETPHLQQLDVRLNALSETQEAKLRDELLRREHFI